MTDELKPSPEAVGVADRFWSKVEIAGESECWPWLGSKKRSGYGTIPWKGRTRSAPQVSWELANGHDWPAGLDSCHVCDNRACVNPLHIWPGTRRQNVHDMIAKSRAGGATAINAARTHCTNGHPFSGANLILRVRFGRQFRECRICARKYSEAWRVRKRAERKAGLEHNATLRTVTEQGEGCAHDWEYQGYDRAGSHKGEDCYKCCKCKKIEYRHD